MMDSFGKRLAISVVTGALACLASCTAAVPAPAPEEFRVIAYVAGWSMPAAVPVEKLTHINFAFARIDDNGRLVFEDSKFVPALKSLLALKQRNPRLKVLISVGGWEAEGFSDAALTQESRDVFARSAVEFVRAHELDGIDLDWEYPGQGVAGIKFRAEDKQNFTLMLKTLRSQLDAASDADGRSGRRRYLLTIASADREYFEYTEMEKLHVYLDWLNIMSYDFFNSLTATTGHHAGLYASELAAPKDRNADASVRQHLAAGIPPAKLVLGVAFYGRGFAGVNPGNNGLHQRYERYEGDHPFSKLAGKLIGSPGFVRHWDERAKAPFLWNAETRLFITYDDPQSIRAKAEYVRQHRLGGMMFWELSQDRNDELLDAIATSLH
jgi:chitinase